MVQEMEIVAKTDCCAFVLLHSILCLKVQNRKPTVEVTSSDPIVILQ